MKTGSRGNSRLTAKTDEKGSFVLSWNAVEPPSFRPHQGLHPAGTVMPVGAQVKRLLQNKSSTTFEKTRNSNMTSVDNPYHSASRLLPNKKYISSTSTSKQEFTASNNILTSADSTKLAELYNFDPNRSSTMYNNRLVDKFSNQLKVQQKN